MILMPWMRMAAITSLIQLHSQALAARWFIGELLQTAKIALLLELITTLYIVENGALYDITPLRDSTDAATTTAEALDAIETEIDLVSVEGFNRCVGYHN
jgi:hypothetical protein